MSREQEERRKKKGGGRKRKEEKEKGKKEKKKRREIEEKERERRSAGFAATVGSMRRLWRNTTHAEQVEQRDETVIGAGVGTADRWKGF